MVSILEFTTFTLVKKLITIFLLLQIVTNNAFAEELIKVPRLITHYLHHTTKHKDTKDFFDFLHKHYSNHHQTENHSQQHGGEDNDCQLPFKHCGSCCLNVHVPAIGFVPPPLNTHSLSIQVQAANFISENDRIESLDLPAVWQPPKLA